MASAENIIINGILLKAADFNSILFRNSVGLFKTTKGNKIRTGLCKGSSDLIGWTSIEIAEDLISIFTAVEVKTKKARITKEQRNFLNAVNDSGGIGMIVYNVKEYEILMSQSIQAIKHQKNL